MFKKAGVVAMAAAGLMLLGSPAFATAGDDHEGWGGSTAIGELEYYSEYDEVNFSDHDEFEEGETESITILSNINVCDIIPIPILSDDETYCINEDNDNNDNNGDEENVVVHGDK
ncbi:hypothetical protein [Saccharothrix yanglingensis]|uniref:Secreted protein n=1 Tax=Saccharothrix yanglingensis TaxID=659496 RepID=A0ABU0WXY8_9PSEU|nr:hypothetical protein [Saccharothrix yanglingensis]MDQ2584709.1 hypothetical protein [Saccharothrix yanglingensis]